jgi:SAM-dependent methyltransferase
MVLDMTNGLTLQRIAVADAYASPTGRIELDAEISELTLLAEQHNRAAGGPALDFTNPAVAQLFDPARRPALTHWRQHHVPTAAALVPLQRPDRRVLADGTPFSPHDDDWYRHSLDAIGIRSRAAIMGDVLQRSVAASGKRTHRWLSLACGASIPVFETAQALRADGHDVEITLADFDGNALELARELAAEYDLVDCVELVRMNVLNADRLAAFEPASYEVIDILGLFEYLPDADRVRERRVTLGAVGLLRAARRLLAPGGTLVFANMLDSHPRLAFLLNVIQWPHLQPRSADEVEALMRAAGLPADRSSAFVAEDGVYAVYVSTNPSTREEL